MPLCLLLSFFVLCHPSCFLNGVFIEITTIIVKLMTKQAIKLFLKQQTNTCISPYVIFLFADTHTKNHFYPSSPDL